MKILQVEINNYRQYRGQNIVKLSSDEKKNITIIQGENGCGKSNFMNAITWCLYDEEMFKSKNNEGRDVVNEQALFEEGGKVEVSVIVTLGNDKPEYIFKRISTFGLDKGRSYVIDRKFIGKQIDPDKGTVSINNPARTVENVFIRSSLKSFFFFDGEQMAKYFEDTSRIKANVEQIAQVDLIDDVLQTLRDVHTELNRERKKITQNQQALGDAPDDILERQASVKSDLEQQESELAVYDAEIRKIDDYLQANSNTIVKSLQEQRKTLTDQRSRVNTQLNESKKMLRDTISSSVAPIYAYTAMKYSLDLIEEGTKKGQLPPKIRDIFIKELLESGKCICGHDLKDDPDARKHVEELLNNIVSDDIAMDSQTGKFVLGNIIRSINFSSRYRIYKSQVTEHTDELSQIAAELNGISDQLATFDEQTIAEKEDARRQLERQKDQCLKTIGAKTQLLQILDKQKKDNESYYAKEAKINSQLKRVNYQMDYLNELIGQVTDIRGSIVEDIRIRLESHTREYFFNMIWKKDAFSDVRILNENNRYRISVLSSKGQECLADISAGEQQTLALSFTAALYLVSGYSAPVFIDTPLGRISGTPRLQVSKRLPEYLSETQVVILPTDTEYTQDVRNNILPSVGCEYRINFDSETKTSKVVDYGE